MSSAKKKPMLKERLQEHIAEYGTLAFIIFFSIFAVTYLGFYIAIKTGMDVGDSAAGNSGTLFAAWVATKFTLPFRIGATFVLTPMVAAVIHKVKGKGNEKSVDEKGQQSDPSATKSSDDAVETHTAEGNAD